MELHLLPPQAWKALLLGFLYTMMFNVFGLVVDYCLKLTHLSFNEILMSYGVLSGLAYAVVIAFKVSGVRGLVDLDQSQPFCWCEMTPWKVGNKTTETQFEARIMLKHLI
jgi:hypothetical protein